MDEGESCGPPSISSASDWVADCPGSSAVGKGFGSCSVYCGCPEALMDQPGWELEIPEQLCRAESVARWQRTCLACVRP